MGFGAGCWGDVAADCFWLEGGHLEDTSARTSAAEGLKRCSLLQGVECLLDGLVDSSSRSSDVEWSLGAKDLKI